MARGPDAATPVEAVWADEVLSWNRALGADEALEARWRAIRGGEGVVVVTGQQPGVWGGPLYLLYKLATAVALARSIEASLRTPALAVFWLVGDDSDFGEVSTAWLPVPVGPPVKVQDKATPPGGSLIGSLPASRQAALVQAHKDRLLLWGRGRMALNLLTEATEVGRDWSGVQATLLHRMLPGGSFLVVDGAQRSLLLAARDRLASWAETPLVGDLERGAEESRVAGFDPALDSFLGDRSLFRIVEGDREGSPPRRLPLEGRPSPDDLLGPNVILRPLLQDSLLPNVATVCGPSEIRYRSQLGPIYRRNGIPEPLLIPRLKADLVPRLDPEMTMKPEDEAVLEGTTDPVGFVADLARRYEPKELLTALEAVRRDLRSNLDDLRAPLRSFDASLEQLLDSGGGKADYQLRRLVEGVEGKARQRLFRRSPILAHWRDWLRPRDAEQERGLVGLTPFLCEEPVSVLMETAGDHLERLRTGERLATALLLLEGVGGGDATNG